MANPSRKAWWDGFQSSRQSVYIFPNFFGILFLLGVTLTFSLGLYHGRPLLQFLAFLMALFFLVGMIQSNQNLTFISFESLRVKPTETKTQAHFFLRVQNESEEARLSIKTKLIDFKTKSNELLTLSPFASKDFTFTFQAPERGIYPYPKVQLSSSFPIGFFFVWRKKEWEGDWIVYPKSEGISLFASEIDLGGSDFKEHRKHRPGESERKIDWKAHARGAKRLVKEFEEQGFEEEHFSWTDLSFADPEKKLSQLTLWVLEAWENKIPFSLALPNHALALGTGEKHFHQALKMLAGHPK